MARLQFRLRAWAAWLPGQIEPAAAESLPLLLRRRISGLGQQALRAAWSLSDSAAARLIFASRHGEFGRTLSILDALAKGEEVSPADFTLSVHHALAGLLSIARGNRHGHTTIAAGGESFGFGLLEALSCLVETPAEPVVLVYYDEPLPPPFSDFADAEDEPVALALVIAAEGPGETLSLATTPTAGAPQDLGQAKAFLQFLHSGADAATFMGERFAWHWGRSDAVA